VWVHRKGATRAREGERLVIPGNMGQGSAICVGLGNAESFCSSSHGAGRRLGRQEARRTLNLAEERAKLDALGVTLSAGRDGALDEMPAAYKDFREDMDAQADLVAVEHWLTPIGVIKG
jgi:tRNA-splicing ligase RtcB